MTLCTDDRWCRDCVRENDRKLAATRSIDQSTNAAIAQAATGNGRSTRSATVGRSADDNSKVNERCVPNLDVHKRSGKSNQNEHKSLTESTATVSVVSAAPAKVATPCESEENIVPIPDLDSIRSCSFTAKTDSSRNTVLGCSVIDLAGVCATTIGDNSGSMNELCINELLSFVSFYRNKSNIDALRRSVLSFFVPTDICQAKKLLSTKYATKLESSQFLADRRNSATRSAHEAETDDIIGMFEVLDLKGDLGGLTFVASNLDNLPKFGPEEFNLATVVDRQVRADAAIKDISVALEHLTSTQAGLAVSAFDSSGSCLEMAKQLYIVDVQQKMDSFSTCTFGSSE